MSAENAWRIAREILATMPTKYLARCPMPPAFRAEVEAEAEELREMLAEALRPFADEAKSRCVDDEAWRDTDTIRCVLTIGLLRNVVALLSRLEAKGESQ